MVEDRFKQVTCLKCGHVGLLYSGICKVPECQQKHKIEVVK